MAKVTQPSSAEMSELASRIAQIEKVSGVETAAQQQEAQLLEALARLGGQRVTDEDLIFKGRQMVIPQTMTAHDAVKYLEDHIEQQEEETRFSRVFPYRPLDGAHALQAALRKVFGTAGIGKATYTFFGKQPPEMRSIPVGVNKTEQVPWGILSVPLFKGKMHLSASMDPEYGPLFALVIDAPRRYRAEVEGLFMAVLEELKVNSIYRSAAIDGQVEPEFIDLTGVDPAQVIYSDEVMIQLDANIWSLLRHSQTMRDLNMPLKRAVLLEGPYGTGKTLAAFLTAQVATANGWSFIYCRPGRDDLAQVLSTARLYQPCVVFFEDVDVIASPRDGSDSVTQLLDMFDGINAKGTELLAILTTNHKEKIHKGMVRPGRLDAMVHIGALDQSGVIRMIKALVPSSMLDEALDYDAVYEAMQGFLPAFVKEAVDRAMRYAIARNDGKPSLLMTDDFVDSASGLRPQLELMEGASESGGPESLGSAIERHVRTAVDKTSIVDNDGDQVFSLDIEG